MSKKSEVVQMYIYPLEDLKQNTKASHWQAIKENVDRVLISPNSRIPEIRHRIVSVCFKQGG